MAREESSREDLMREATGLRPRIEFTTDDEPAPVIVGFRRGGAASVFFGEDPVVQFNARGELRRGFFQGRLIKAERGRLAMLTRVRAETQTQLVRREMNAAETAEFLREVQRRLLALRDALTSGNGRVLRQVPEDDDVLGAVLAWLNSLEKSLPIARSPGVQ
jgi:hypothetical protein